MRSLCRYIREEYADAVACSAVDMHFHGIHLWKRITVSELESKTFTELVNQRHFTIVAQLEFPLQEGVALMVSEARGIPSEFLKTVRIRRLLIE